MSPLVYDNEDGDKEYFDCSNVAEIQERSNGSYLGDAYYPAPYLFVDADYMSNQVLFDGGPWFVRDQLGNDLFMSRYATDCWFPGSVQIGLIKYWCWHYQFACYYEDLFIKSRTPLEVVRGRFARRVIDGFNRLKTYIAIQPSQSGMFLFHTHGE